jgi:COMPASS component SWD2
MSSSNGGGRPVGAGAGAGGSSSNGFILDHTVIPRYSIASVIPPSSSDASKDQRANSLAFSENGRYLVSSHNDGVINLISGATGERECEFHLKDAGARLITATHHEMGYLHAAATPVGHPCPVSYHNIYENKIVRYFKGHTDRVTSISLCPESDIFLTTGLDGKFILWDVRSPVAAATGSFPIPDKGTFQGLEPPHPVGAFESSGKVFAIALPQRGIAMYNAMHIGAPQKDFDMAKAPFAMSVQPLMQYTTSPTRLDGMPGDAPLPPPFPSLTSFVDLQFSPDGDLIAAVTTDRGILILNSFCATEEFALLNAHPFDALHPSSVSWSPDSRFLLVGGVDGHVWVYDLLVPSFVKDMRKKLDDNAPFPYRPGFWEPPVFVLGEGNKTAAARESAYATATKHRSELYEKMHKLRKDFATSKNLSVDSLGPPKGVPAMPVPLATNADEQTGRHEAPVTCVKWHPTSTVVASAARTVAVWAITPTKD